MLTHELRLLTSIERRPQLPNGVTLHEVILDAVEGDGDTHVAAFANLYRVDLDIVRQSGCNTLHMTGGKTSKDGVRAVQIEVGAPINRQPAELYYDPAYGFREFVWVADVDWRPEVTSLTRLGTMLLGSYLRLCPIHSGELLIHPDFGSAGLTSAQREAADLYGAAIHFGKFEGFETRLNFDAGIGRARFGGPMRYDRSFTVAVDLAP